MSLLERVIAVLAALLLIAALKRWISFDMGRTAVLRPGKEAARLFDDRILSSAQRKEPVVPPDDLSA